MNVMIIRKSSIEILETPYDKLESESERMEKSFIEGNLCQNEPIFVHENEVIYTIIQHDCIDVYCKNEQEGERKLLEKLMEKWDTLSLAEKEVAHCINATMPILQSIGELPSSKYDDFGNGVELLSKNAITKDWLKYAREIINSKPEIRE